MAPTSDAEKKFCGSGKRAKREAGITGSEPFGQGSRPGRTNGRSATSALTHTGACVPVPGHAVADRMELDVLDKYTD